MKRMLTGFMLFVLTATISTGQTPIFSEDFESGMPSTDWSLYRLGEEPIEAVDMSSAPQALADGGSYVGYINDADASYAGAAIALAGTANDSNYTIEGDVYVYTYHPGGSAYTGLAFYADSSKNTYYKLVADFDANNRFRLYNNHVDTLGSYTFHQEFDASGVDTSEGWHHMKIVTENLPGGYPSFTCYYDGEMLGDGAYIDSSESRLTSGQWGVYAFQFSFSTGLPGYFDNIEVTEEEVPVAIKEGPGGTLATPLSFALAQNHPNPFNPRTTINFQIHTGTRVILEVYSPTGQMINKLIDGYLSPRHYSVVWDGRDATGRPVPSGIYIYSLTNATQREAKRMLLLK
ncbi:MAG: hypothetical protein JSW54_13175 [Fidelibacterota bacterium]|nr:MAG: hypothetical protein JSW54_13175 [Candidatus Neomarinimicrobiota bacterium]